MMQGAKIKAEATLLERAIRALQTAKENGASSKKIAELEAELAEAQHRFDTAKK